MDLSDRTARFRQLHERGTFVLANAFDPGSARILAGIGFQALATTSSGHAASMGRLDMTVDRAALVAHVRSLAAATELPLSVDAERCFPDDPGGVAGTVEVLADAGAAGCSIEDWNPVTETIEPLDLAVERVAQATAAATGLVLTARAENHIRGRDDLGDTIERLCAYRRAGADVVYAPGLITPGAISAVLEAIDAPLNVLLLGNGPSVPLLAELGVRRISVGGAFAFVAYEALRRAGESLLETGAFPKDTAFLSRDVVNEVFSPPGA